MSIDLEQLITDITSAASAVLQADITEFRGFSARQLQAIAQQTAFVAAGIASGEITAETREFFLDSLEDMALNFVRTLRGLLTVTIEKVWNAIVGVLWSALSSAVGIALPIPRL